MNSKDDKSSSAPTKVSLVFGGKPKSGFVIPKNKLSGSLVPVLKTGAKNESSSKEEGCKESQRKTKWNYDFTLDPSVRKTRALAYQTRLDQIHKLLNLMGTTGEDTGQEGTGEYDDDGLGPNAASPNKEMDRESQQQLEIERREIIGEILNLNPSFKPPADYKPLLKEAKVPIAIKAYPGYNFLQMLLGAESTIQKRIEDETGVKIQVHGIKKGTGEKCEITQAEIHEGQSAYDELYIVVSSETYNKLDSAVSLLELFLTQATSPPVQASSSPPTILVNTKPTIPQYPSYSHLAPNNSISPPVRSSPVRSSPVYHYNPYTGQDPPFRPRPQNLGPPPPHHHFPPHGPGPHRPPYHEAPLMQMHGPPPQHMWGPPIRPPVPASNNFTYQPNTPFRPMSQNPPNGPNNQFGFQMGPLAHHGFQYPRTRMGSFGPAHAGPGRIWNNSNNRPNSGGMGRNFRGNGNNSNQNYDPFLPSSGPVRPRREGKVEADPEYEDLMASVGVK